MFVEQSVEIKKGENLTQVANKNHTSVIALIRLNNLKDPDKLNIGQIIKLPVNIPAVGNKSGNAPLK